MWRKILEILYPPGFTLPLNREAMLKAKVFLIKPCDLRRVEVGSSVFRATINLSGSEPSSAFWKNIE
jgi:hypothetical protein